MNRTFDAVIIGAGPAGSAAAISLARKGARVALLEAGRFPREKVCGEFVSAESLALLHSLLSGAEEERISHAGFPISEARLFVGGGGSTLAPVSPPAASIARVELDHNLWKAAQRAGAECLEESPALRVEHGENFKVLLDRGHRVIARCVLDGTGRWSRLHVADQAKLLSKPGPKWIGVKAHFFEHRPSESVDLYFFECGYCGVQPVGENEINVCAMVRSDRARSLPEVFRLHAALQERARSWTVASEPVSTSPLIFRERKPVADSVFHIGDAAGFIDPFVGDGIALALRSGALAAEIAGEFLEGKSDLQQALRKYESVYAKRFEPIFRSAERLRVLLELPGPLRTLTLSALKFETVAAYLVRKTRGHADQLPAA